MIRDYFARARDERGDWSASEFGVVEIPSALEARRVWVGQGGGGLLAAFFECAEEEQIDVAISQTIQGSTARVTSEAGEDIHAVQVRCLDSRLNEVFFKFLEDVVEALAAGQSISGALASTANEWRSLLAVAKAGISRSSLHGLFGELCILRTLAKVLPADALRIWTGPEGGRHDFVGHDTSMEVKTSSLQNRQAVTIHGLRQLDPAEGSELHLAVVEVDPHPQGQLVDEVVDDIIDLGVERTALREKLATLGFVPGMPGSGEDRFSLVSTKIWAIRDNTPVLRRSALPEAVVNAVSDVRYSLDLAALGQEFTEEFDFSRLRLTEGTIPDA